MDKKFQKGSPLPKSLGACADLYNEVRTLRLGMQKETDAVGDREKEIKQHLIDNLSVSEDTGVAGKKYRAQIKTEDAPKVDDWEEFRKFIIATDRWDLMQKRLADKAVKEVWEEDGKDGVPGVSSYINKKVSITKI